MKDIKKHARSFSPRYYEMDRHGCVTPLTMLSLFEETAFSHCDDTGWSVYRLRTEGLGWVMLHGGFRFDRYPRFRESFTIETWLTAARLFYGLREFAVRDESGGLIGSARSLWVFYDRDRRRPVPILEDILRGWGHDPSVDLDRDPPSFEPPAPERMDLSRAYDVRISDIDTNDHVNNVNYLEWALESVPPEVQDRYELASVEGRYLHEVRYGQRVRPASEEVERSDSRLGYSLAVYADNGAAIAPRLVACARSTWQVRSEELNGGIRARDWSSYPSPRALVGAAEAPGGRPRMGLTGFAG